MDLPRRQRARRRPDAALAGRRARARTSAACLLIGLLSPVARAEEPPPSSLPSVTTRPAEDRSLDTRDRLTIRRFRFVGNTRFTDAELGAVVAGYVGRPIFVEQLEEARAVVTKHYVDRGYINSGAVLPDQEIDGAADAVVRLRVVEGRLGDIHLTGNVRLRDGYLTGRLRHRSGPPLDVNRLTDQLEILRQDPNVRAIRAELRPGAVPGESVLDVNVQEGNPWRAGLTFSNRRPPSVGSGALDLTAAHTNLTGNGDVLSVRYDVINGTLGDLQFAGLDDFSVDYSIPITPADTTLSFGFSRSDTIVLEEPFQDLDINSESTGYTVTVRHPLYRRPVAVPATVSSPGRAALEIGVFASLSVRDSESFLLGEPFGFTEGDDGGRNRVVALRLGQDLTARSQDYALSLRSTFSLGLPVAGATTRDGDLPDGQFFAWLGQAQYARLLGPSDIQLVLRGAVQLSSGRLLDTEQFVVGGIDTVRGYRANTLVRDAGAAGTVEFRIPVFRRGGDDVLTVVPFVDAGYGTDVGGGSSGETLCSVGVGLVYTPDPRVNVQVYYGYALTNRSDSQQDLQDLGIHFSLSVNAF